MEYVAATVIGYLIGSVPFALMVARRHGVDLRRTADGNPGAWNALEQLGPRRALPAFLGDGAKGLAAGVAGWALGGFWGAWAGVAGAMIGHALPAFAGFRGGKGVMTFVGGAIALSPLAAAGAAAVGVLAGALSRSFARGAQAGVFAFPLVQLAIDSVVRVLATGALMTLIGALFALRRRSAVPATPETAAPPTT